MATQYNESVTIAALQSFSFEKGVFTINLLAISSSK